MKSIFYFLLLFLISISSKAQLSKNLRAYRMKEIAVQTKWANEVRPNNALKEYPRPQLERENWINLNGLWDYGITTKEEKVQDYNGKILVPYPLESALSGVKKSLQPEQVLWYHRTFENPIRSRNKFGMTSGDGAAERLLLNFGAVSWAATVYINGKEAGNHQGAYTAFALDITGLLKSGRNDIKVKVWNPLEKGIGPRGKQTLNPSGMWYTPSSGIWQTVWLEKVPEDYIKSIKVTPDVDKGILKLEIKGAGKLRPLVVVTDPKTKQEISRRFASLEITSEGCKGEIVIPNAKLWSPDSPHLYDLEITMGKDKVKSYFGMRKVEIKKDEKGIDRIFLNNKYTYNLGTLDQGFWPDGLYTAPTDEALKFDIEAIKAMGFNTIRKHIKVEPARWYYHADQLGMLVWQDLVQPGGKLEQGGQLAPEVKQQFEKESAEILGQFSHFPSITTWGLFNERWGEYDQQRLAKWVKDTDPTRLLNGHSGAAIVDGKLDKGHIADVATRAVNSDMTDVHSYPPPAIPNHIAGKAMVLGEFGGIGVQVDGHLWDDLQSIYSYGKTVGVKEMQSIYSKMNDSLVKFEKHGLSASIYTQPYDVEGEQNGIMTYDRKVTKIPFSLMRSINCRLWPVSGTVRSLNIVNADTAIMDFDKDVALFKAGKIDSVFLRRLTIRAAAIKNRNLSTILAEAYLNQVNDIFSEANLRFIKRFSISSKNKYYDVLKSNKDKIEKVLGKGEYGVIMGDIVHNEFIAPRMLSSPDWEAIEKEVLLKYSDIKDLAVEKVLQDELIYTYNKLRNWKRVIVLGSRWIDMKNQTFLNGYWINVIAWKTFQNCSSQEWLFKALGWSKKSLEFEPENDLYVDTYANILYKLGRTDEAIEWEEKAIVLNPDESIYKDNLKKMRDSVPTWLN